MVEIGNTEFDGPLGIIALLVIAWLALEVAGEFLELTSAVLGPLRPLLGLLLLAAIALWAYDNLL
jgi:hypothetical protein